MILDWDRIPSPYLSPDAGVLGALVQCGRAVTVETVIVVSQPVFDEGPLIRIDAEADRTELARFISLSPSGTERRNRDNGLRLLEDGRRFYDADDAGPAPS